MKTAWNNSREPTGKFLAVFRQQTKKEHRVFRFRLREAEGFTLLEVLVSLAVIALVVVSLFRVQSGSIELSDAARFYRTAPLLAQDRLAWTVKDLADMKAEDSGDFEAPYDTYAWQSRVTDVDLDAQGDLPDKLGGGLKKIEITIQQQTSGRRFHVAVFRYQDETLDEK